MDYPVQGAGASPIEDNYRDYVRENRHMLNRTIEEIEPSPSTYLEFEKPYYPLDHGSANRKLYHGTKI